MAKAKSKPAVKSVSEDGVAVFEKGMHPRSRRAEREAEQVVEEVTEEAQSESEENSKE